MQTYKQWEAYLYQLSKLPLCHEGKYSRIGTSSRINWIQLWQKEAKSAIELEFTGWCALRKKESDTSSRLWQRIFLPIISLLQDCTFISMDVRHIYNYPTDQIKNLELEKEENKGKNILRSSTFRTTCGYWLHTFSLSCLAVENSKNRPIIY